MLFCRISAATPALQLLGVQVNTATTTLIVIRIELLGALGDGVRPREGDGPERIRFRKPRPFHLCDLRCAKRRNTRIIGLIVATYPVNIFLSEATSPLSNNNSLLGVFPFKVQGSVTVSVVFPHFPMVSWNVLLQWPLSLFWHPLNARSVEAEIRGGVLRRTFPPLPK